jgi:hypothetical protein
MVMNGQEAHGNNSDLFKELPQIKKIHHVSCQNGKHGAKGIPSY